MKIAIVGGGPAGLYLALLLKKQNARMQVGVFERHAPSDTFGWGVVFSDQTLGNLRAADAETYQQIADSFAHWDDIDIHFRGHTITSGGHGFSGIARKRLIEILQNRAAESGVDLHFRTEVLDEQALAAHGYGDTSLIVAADGINSRWRERYGDAFRPDLDPRKARFAWFGTTRLFDAFTFIFVENEHGLFQVHAYRFDEGHSAFIVECDERSWRNAGLDTARTEQSLAFCEQLFAHWLDGHPLMSNAAHLLSPWTRFVRVRNEHWFHRLPNNANGPRYLALLGDAAHSAHFSIGSGTKLAMEDGIALARLLAAAAPADLPRVLLAYHEERQLEALRLQNAARNSMEWFEDARRYIRMEPQQFAYSLLTRSQRVSHENLRVRDRAYLDGVERWFAEKSVPGEAGAAATGMPVPEAALPRKDEHARVQQQSPSEAVPPMFTPFRLRGLTLHNRVVVSPMDMYSAEDGLPNPFHLVHLGSRALGGAALVMTEMTCVSPEARITLGCTGLYNEAQVDAWRQITRFVHEWSAAKICLQLGHSGRKGSTKLMWEGMDAPLEHGGWPTMGPSAMAYAPGGPAPRPMTRADMDRVLAEFVCSTELAVRAEFDMLELHCAHGYLLSSFLTPLSNCRTDRYGGSLANRLRYPLEVFAAVRAAWPADRPISVRISATDWVEGGVDPAESVRIARAFQEAGCDIIHVSAGQTTPDAKPVYGRMFQTPLSDRIRNEAGVPTIAVGNITEADQVNGIIAAGRADLCALARPHLSDPNWTLHAAAAQGYTAQPWPVQYLSGKAQLERQVQRQAEMLGGGES